MKKEIYNNFLNDIKTELKTFLFKYDIAFNCKFPQNAEDDEQYTIDLGEVLGKVNVLFESYSNLPENEKNSDTFTICMRYHESEHIKNALNCNLKPFLSDDGVFILCSSENALEGLKNDFKEVLNIWSQNQDEKIAIIDYHNFYLN